MNECFVVISGGGTAGHVHPGLATAKALVAKGHPVNSVLYVGSSRGIEKDLIPPAGFELVVVSGEGIPRRNLLLALKAIWEIMRGTVQAIRLLRKRNPKVVLALGGFACIPCAIAAAVLRIPVVVHEQNAVPGLANRVISRWAYRSAVSFDGTQLRRAEYTGNPVRKEILDMRNIDQTAARETLGVPAENTFIVVTGGSLGAYRLNMALIESIPLLLNGEILTIYHVVGSRDWDEVASVGVDLKKYVDYRPVEYEYDMPTVLRAADLVISRAGGSIAAEIAVLGVPAILIPLPNAPGDHQTANAESLVHSGSAVLIPDKECDGKRVAKAISELISSPHELSRMRHAIHEKSQFNAAELLVDVLERAAK
jgi:undecaprenyldiphospho-muramoylpentapeptide beta-N-acetylglucosaminyltransferase